MAISTPATLASRSYFDPVILSLCRGSLRLLELRIGWSPSKTPVADDAEKLEVLRPWVPALLKPPRWRPLDRLRTLEIVSAAVNDASFHAAVRAYPNLVDLTVVGGDSLQSASIELPRLESCRIGSLDPGALSVVVSSPCLRQLEVHGFSSISVHPQHQLDCISVAMNSEEGCSCCYY